MVRDGGFRVSTQVLQLQLLFERLCGRGLANGKNPIGIIMPCHRVIGSTGNLTGYGLDRERTLPAFGRVRPGLNRRPVSTHASFIVRRFTCSHTGPAAEVPQRGRCGQFVFLGMLPAKFTWYLPSMVPVPSSPMLKTRADSQGLVP